MRWMSPTPAQKTQLRAQLKLQVDAWRAALDTQAATFHKRALELLPFQELWPP